MRETLGALCNLAGPSGFEATVAQRAVSLMLPYVNQANVDRFGNAIGVRLCGKSGAPKLLLDAHLDEIGLVVTKIEDGFLRFSNIGGVDPRMLPNRELTIMTNPPLMGVVSCLPPHILSADSMKKTIPMEELCIDIGLSQEQATAVVPIGTPVVFRETAQPLGTDYISGKSMDDRACFTILLRTLELLQEEALDVDLYVMGSTREEVGGAGATVGTYGINPDYCVAVDVTHGATPDGPKDGTFALGSGPAIGMGPNMTRWMTNRMMDKAKANEIPFEIEVMSGHTGTNGWHMQTVREGIATSVISLPLRYMHTPVETLNVDDMEQVAKLLAAFTRDLGKEVGQR